LTPSRLRDRTWRQAGRHFVGDADLARLLAVVSQIVSKAEKARQMRDEGVGLNA
jgi:hypothetical protein